MLSLAYSTTLYAATMENQHSTASQNQLPASSIIATLPLCAATMENQNSTASNNHQPASSVIAPLPLVNNLPLSQMSDTSVILARQVPSSSSVVIAAVPLVGLPLSQSDTSVVLARQVKQYGTMTFQKLTNNPKTESMKMVIGFDKHLFIQKCNPSSLTYDCTIDFNILADELFQKNEVWAARDGVLLDAVNEVAKYHGFSIKKEKTFIRCNRFGESQSYRNFASGPLACNCTFMIQLKALSKQAKLTMCALNKGAAPTEKWRYTNTWNAPVMIIDKCCEHAGGCTPSKLNRLDGMQRSGKYVTTIPSHPLYTLCNNYDIKGGISSSFIKSVLEPIWPSSKNITTHDVYNVRVRIRRLLPKFKSTGAGDFEAFQSIVNASDLLCGIDDMPTLDDDEAYELAQSAWQELQLTDSTCNADSLFSFVGYLELIKSRAKGFCYELARDNSIKDKPLIGIMWMTATMRRQYELFGGYICLDMMKRGINKLLWPYAAVAMYDDNRNIIIACEGILCGERYDMYEFMATFLGKNATGRPLTSVDVVAGDGFFSQEMIHRLGFSNAHFITDRWHLVDSGLVQKFGLAAHELLHPQLMTMVNANSEVEYEAALQAAYVLLASLPGGRNGEWSEKLDQFASERKTYASYCLNNIQGSREIQGSSASESNHSSVLAFLNEGNKSGNSYCESPITLIRDLMKRQKARNQSINKRLFGESQLMKVEQDSLARLPSTHSKDNLLLASNCLCYTAYERYKTNMHRTTDYKLERSMNTESINDVLYYTVKSTRYPDAPPRILHKENSFRCNCEKKITEQDMCVHEVVAFGFRKSHYQPRHMFRDNITGSVDGWIPQEQSVMNSILEYEIEPIEDDWFACNQEESASSVDGFMASIDDIEEEPTTALLPPAKAIKPLDQKEVQNRMNCLITQYSKMSKHDKFNFCAKLIDFEKECGAGKDQVLLPHHRKENCALLFPQLNSSGKNPRCERSHDMKN